MHYFSTNRKSPHASFREAVLKGQPDDMGLYFPSELVSLTHKFLDGFRNSPNEQIAFEVIRPYVGGDIPDRELFEICRETVDFDFPLVKLTESISTLELFHGPTLAFKDVGARFMSRCLRHFAAGRNRKTMVLVATSGDTGGAVAAGFHGVEGVEVVILYPSGKVSHVQELQLTTLGGNVTTLELQGTFDDCQAIAKQALADDELRSRVHLTSANSINVARWLPQQFYYFYALKQWQGQTPVISVPSGNFGNLASGILAHISGLPVKKFIAACNANDVVPRFINTAAYEPRPSIATISNAMDVGAPSNFVRILEMFEHDFPYLINKLEAASISDDTTAATMREVYAQCNYILDPHGAVGYRALADHIDRHPDQRGIFMETAHPVKFDSVNEILGTKVSVPDAVTDLMAKPKQSTLVGNDYNAVREILLSKI
ncbi:MAG TPA: threonine synthase [Pyrinomonadaceae bacterium]|nr:threonine synthase [Chloracidobacterium sp.]MBP9935752.1 threonine synthase [Pyrinomonadaceae bacterium]MBK7801295.1 threonine synthase [Chloracidobacterium sp.]MBK9436616.1 threonine synthase [Chloracidobacterium sp.]MBL0241604.1 threonine synthase [Chloracidobacterium sp.]